MSDDGGQAAPTETADSDTITTDSQSRALWDGIAEQYGTDADEGEREVYEKLKRILEDEGIPPKGSSLLEAGSGSGQISALLARDGYDVTLLDFSDVALAKSREIFERNGLEARFILADLFEMDPQKTGTHDVVWNSGVLEHFDGWQVIDALQAMSRTAKRLVIFLVPNPGSGHYMEFRQEALKDGAWQWGLEIPRENLDDLVTCAGLQVVSQHYVGESQIEYFTRYVGKGGGRGGRAATAKRGKGGGANRKKKSGTGGGRAPMPDKDRYLKMVVARPAPAKLEDGKRIGLLARILRDDSAVLRNTYYADTSILARGLELERETARRLYGECSKMGSQITGMGSQITNLKRELDLEKETARRLRGALQETRAAHDKAATRITEMTQELDFERRNAGLLRKDLQDTHDKMGSKIRKMTQELDFEKESARLLRKDLQNVQDQGAKITELTQELYFERERIRMLLDSKAWRLTRLYQTKFGGTAVGGMIERMVGSMVRNVDTHLPDQIDVASAEKSQQQRRQQQLQRQQQRRQQQLQRQQQRRQREKTLAQIDRILLDNPGTEGIIVYPPTVDWNIPLLQRPQHMATNMAKNNWLYFYCTTNTYDNVSGFKKLSDRLYLTDRYADLLDRLDKYVVFVHSAHPTFEISDIAKLQGKGTVVYDYLDEIHPSVSVIRSKDVHARHEYMIKNSDAVLVTAKKLYDEASRIRQDGVHLVPNGVEYSHFHKKPDPRKMPREIRSVRNAGRNGGGGGANPIIGYFGAVASWFDYGLIARMAHTNPAWQIVLIGWDYDGTIDKSGIKRLQNVHFMGVKKYDVLPDYACWFDVCILPFHLNDITHATSPIKLFEYMALGKPIVTTAISEAANYKSCIVADSRDDFIDKTRMALGLAGDRRHLALLDGEARENTWEARFQTVDKILHDLDSAAAPAARKKGQAGRGSRRR